MSSILLWVYDTTNSIWVPLAGSPSGEISVEGITGLVYKGTVTEVPAANEFTIPTLAGLGLGKFVSATYPYRAFVFRDNGGLGNPPQGEQRDVTDYASVVGAEPAGTFRTAPFSAPVAVGDEILIMHRSLSAAMPDSPANEVTSVAIKAKTDLIPADIATQLDTNIPAIKAKTDTILSQQTEVPVNITAILASETNFLNLSTASTKYSLEDLVLKCDNPVADTIRVRLYKLVNAVLTDVGAFDITAAGANPFTTYYSLMDMFGVPHMAGDNIKITVQCAPGEGPYSVVGSYTYRSA